MTSPTEPIMEAEGVLERATTQLRLSLAYSLELFEPNVSRTINSADMEAAAQARYRAAVIAVLRALVPPSVEMVAAMTATPGMQEVDAMVRYCAARNRDHKLTWADKGEPPPLVQAFTAAIGVVTGGGDG